MERLSAAYVKSGTPTPQLELELRAIAREIAEAADAVHGIVRAGRGRA